MKERVAFEPQLRLKQAALLAGGEWRFQSPGWSCLRIATGVGYWLNPGSHQELAADSVLIFSDRAPGVIRASQVGDVLIRYFRLNPQRLTGLLTLTEQETLQSAAFNEKSCARHFSGTHPIAVKFKTVCDQSRDADGRSSVLTRLELLELFFRAFGEDFSTTHSPQDFQVDAQSRLKLRLTHTPVSELMDLRFQDLVEEMRCTPRHLSRIFHKVVGMSFREKQTQVRMFRAQELLATTESKVLDVALESGYQSLSLFNLMFKKRFGMTPGEWRSQQRAKAASSRKLRGSLQSFALARR